MRMKSIIFIDFSSKNEIQIEHLHSHQWTSIAHSLHHYYSVVFHFHPFQRIIVFYYSLTLLFSQKKKNFYSFVCCFFYGAYLFSESLFDIFRTHLLLCSNFARVAFDENNGKLQCFKYSFQ